jgi:hypothetical protein
MGLGARETNGHGKKVRFSDSFGVLRNSSRRRERGRKGGKGQTQLHPIRTKIDPVRGIIAILAREPGVDGKERSGSSSRVYVVLEELDLVSLKTRRTTI